MRTIDMRLELPAELHRSAKGADAYRPPVNGFGYSNTQIEQHLERVRPVNSRRNYQVIPMNRFQSKAAAA